MTTDNIRLVPGNIKINSANIISTNNRRVDVSRLVAQLNLYEDVMSPFITGTLLISDAIALAELLPFIGEEMLVLDIETPGFDDPIFKRTSVFHIYRVEGKENITTKNVGYTICFSSIDAFTDVNVRISQTYRGKISDIAEKLIKSSPGLASSRDSVIEPTSNNEIYTSNFWSPSQNLYYLTTKAVNKIGNPGYVFFENNEGYVFASVDGLIGAKTMANFVRHEKTRRQGENLDMNEEYQTILDMSTPKLFDYMERVQQGYYGGAAYQYDLETKRLNFRNLVSRVDLKKNMLNNYDVTSTGETKALPDANMHLNIINRNLYTGSPAVSILHNVKRMSIMTQLQAVTTNIRVYGRLDYSVGRVVELLIYSDRSIDKSSTDEVVIDDFLSGNYLITALSHEITRDGHLCNLELCKDSVLKQI